MNYKYALLSAAALATVFVAPQANAWEYKTEYYSVPLPTVTTTSAPVTIERSVNGAGMVEQTTVTAPVTLEGSNGGQVLMEDRIIKKKHLFGIGIWPLFDVSIL